MNREQWRMKRAREGMVEAKVYYAEVAPPVYIEVAPIKQTPKGDDVSLARPAGGSGAVRRPHTIRPDVHARFLKIRERADARVAEELAALASNPMASISYGRHGYPDRDRVEIRPRSDPKPYASRVDGPRGWQDDEGR